MSLLVITQIHHSIFKGDVYAYGPYTKEMNIWFKFFDRVHIISPFVTVDRLNPIEIQLEAKSLIIHQVPDFNMTSLVNIFKSLILMPYIFFKIIYLLFKIDHVHLRCPGNMGLLGSIAQVFFPFKKKTAKYAGNWDFKSKQPISYRLQQLILKSTFLSRNMKILVYGDWPSKTKNMIPFFTASYKNADIVSFQEKTIRTQDEPVNFIFVGSLVQGKNPDFCLDFCKKLFDESVSFKFNFFGEGPLLDELILKAKRLNFEDFVTFHRNVPSCELIQFFKKSHFLIFLSDSEGWPKVVAESMFWSCIPVTSSVSCIPQMVNYGERGLLVPKDVDVVFNQVLDLIQNPQKYYSISKSAYDWSIQFTLEKFESELHKLI